MTPSGKKVKAFGLVDSKQSRAQWTGAPAAGKIKSNDQFRYIPSGGFLRSNPERDNESNLNSQGMVFKKLCMTDLNDRLENEELELDPIIKGHLLELVYGSVARLSALAAGREIAALGAK